MDDHIFPFSLEVFIINSTYFNQDLTPILKNLHNLKTLILGNGYEKELLYLPPTLEYLKVGFNYKHNLDTIIRSHSNLKYIEVSAGYPHIFNSSQSSIFPFRHIKVDKETYMKLLFERECNIIKFA